MKSVHMINWTSQQQLHHRVWTLSHLLQKLFNKKRSVFILTSVFSIDFIDKKKTIYSIITSKVFILYRSIDRSVTKRLIWRQKILFICLLIDCIASDCCQNKIWCNEFSLIFIISQYLLDWLIHFEKNWWLILNTNNLNGFVLQIDNVMNKQNENQVHREEFLIGTKPIIFAIEKNFRYLFFSSFSQMARLFRC